MAYTCSLTCSSPSGLGLAAGELLPLPEHRRNSSANRDCNRMKCPNGETAQSSSGGAGEAVKVAVIFGPSRPTAGNARSIGTPRSRSSIPP